MSYSDCKEIFVIKYLVKVWITGKRNDWALIKIQNKGFINWTFHLPWNMKFEQWIKVNSF